ncbi:MAG: hypothetical protein ACRD1K_10820 [Acidimicrobiales bacterium]
MADLAGPVVPSWPVAAALIDGPSMVTAAKGAAVPTGAPPLPGALSPVVPAPTAAPTAAAPSWRRGRN